MKVLLGLLALTSAVVAETTTAPNGETRICPDNYFYAGEDSSPSLYTRSYWQEEVARSDVYSCYSNLQLAPGGFNEALGKCEAQQSRLVAFESEAEYYRFFEQLANRHADQDNDTVLTSGMYFSDVEEFMWLGTNGTVDYTIENIEPVEQCLAAYLRAKENAEEDAEFEDKYDVIFVSTKCNDPAKYVCELRAQTVTYVTWFYSNWLTFLLSVILMLLLVTLCITAIGYSSKKSNVYREQQQQQRHQQQQMQGYASTLPVYDAPPAYKDVAGNPSMMDKYKAKGKELLAKVYFFKDGSTATTTPPPSDTTP